MIWNSPEAWALSALLVPLLLLHRYRRRRQERQVSSLMLWDFLDTRDPPRRRKYLKENLHLLLQVLILILFSASLADPQWSRPEGGGGRRIIILDGSASMTAGEKRQRRFDLALGEARKLIRLRGPGETAVILAGAEPVVLSDFTGSRRRLLSALKTAVALPAEAAEEQALSLAFQLTRGIETELFIISDGGFQVPPGETALPVHYRRVGRPEENLGVTAFNGRQDEVNPEKHHLFAAVFNGSEARRPAVLTLLLNGEVKERREVILPPGEESSFFFLLEGPEGRAELVIEDTDLFPWDNRAFLLINRQDPVQILLVSQGNYYLEKLLGIMPGAEYTRAERLPPAAGFDLVIFDSPVRDPLPVGNYLFLGYPPPLFPAEPEEPVLFPGVSRWDSDHPVMEGVNPRNFTVYQTAGFSALPPSRAVLEGAQPLISVFEDDLTRAVFFNFSLAATDLPLRTEFPLLMANLISWIHRDPLGEIYETRPGGRWIIHHPLAPAERLRIASGSGDAGRLTRPGGTEETIMPREETYRFMADLPGFYRLDAASGEREWAVNLLAVSESDLRMPDPWTADQPPGSDFFQAPDEQDYRPLRSWLLAVAALLLIGERLLARRGLTGAGKTGRKDLVLAALALVFTAAALFNPVLPLGGRKLSLIYLLDTSQSISPATREAAVNWIRASAREEANLETTAVISFGGEALLASPPGPVLKEVRMETLPDGTRTNPTAALHRALALLPPRGDRRIILLSDGRENIGDLKGTLTALAGPGLILHTLAVAGDIHEKEVLVKNLTAPARVSPQEKFAVSLEIESLTDSRTRLFFYLDGHYFGEDDLSLTGGTTPLLYHLNLTEPGYHLLEVMIQPEEDGRSENNRLQKVIFVRGQPPLLYLHGNQGESDFILNLLEKQGYEVRKGSGADFPETLTELFSYQAVILDNLSAFELSLSEMEMLRQAAAGGLGVLALGGDSSFGLGGYYKTPLETLLPVDVDIASSMDMPGLALVMLIDKSGTMQEQAGKDDQGDNRLKIDLAKQAVMAAVEVLKPTYQAGILSFDADFQWTIPLTEAGNLDTIREGLFPLSPGGGTALFPALQEAHRVLSRHEAAVKHLLVLSDGHTLPDDFETLMEQIRNDGITLSTVALGKRADRDFMETLAREGKGRTYYAEDIQSVPAIFAGESLKASKRLAVEETFFPVMRAGHPVLQGFQASDIPPLRGFVLSYPKEEADILLQGPGDHPLLAVKQYGLGRTAAFTSSLDTPWTEPWMSWEGAERLFAQLIRHIARGEGYEGISFGLVRRGRTGEILVNARSPEEGFLNHLGLTARVVGPDLRDLMIPLVQTGPGRYRGTFPLNQEGSYFVTLTREDEQKTTTSTAVAPSPAPGGEHLDSASDTYGTAVISLPYPDEYRRLSPDLDFLKETAALTGGQLLSLSEPLNAGFFVPDPEMPSHPLPLWPLLVLLSLISFLGALLFRLGSREDLAGRLKKLYHRVMPVRKAPPVTPHGEEAPSRKEDYWFGRTKTTKESHDHEKE